MWLGDNKGEHGVINHVSRRQRIAGCVICKGIQFVFGDASLKFPFLPPAATADHRARRPTEKRAKLTLKSGDLSVLSTAAQLTNSLCLRQL
ncbi:hypothetical protein H9L39_17973 [Fusarium oxysporum f. sp. albedinis]|nr:hypothetical protein H9L39_17973 [Fusarium oxysporum f. sp. albedinis]